MSNNSNFGTNEVGSLASDFDFEEVKLTVEEYREEILYESKYCMLYIVI